MNTKIEEHQLYGRCLYADNGVYQIIIPLDFGLRIGHFSFVGGENLFYEQKDISDGFVTDEGWRIRGGHRLWIAPESPLCYSPDNEAVSYSLEGEKIILTQTNDERLELIKSFEISFCDEGVRIKHKVKNTSKKTKKISLWAISVMAAGGKQRIPLPTRKGGFDPWYRFSYWDHTNPGDERAKYSPEEITITHLPLENRFKLGIGHSLGKASYENKGVLFEKHFEIDREKEYPDSNCSYETFLSKYMTEMESLSPWVEIAPGESAEHSELWSLKHL